MTKCPRCRLDIERRIVGFSPLCDVTECANCGYEMHEGECDQSLTPHKRIEEFPEPREKWLWE